MVDEKRRASVYVCSNCGDDCILKTFRAVEQVKMNDFTGFAEPYGNKAVRWVHSAFTCHNCGQSTPEHSDRIIEPVEIGKLPSNIPVGSLVEILWGANKGRWCGLRQQWRPSAIQPQGIITKINEINQVYNSDSDGLIRMGFYSVTIMTSPYEYEKETTITIADIGKVLSSGS